MYDSKKLEPACGGRDAARPTAMQDFHPLALAATLALRAPGGRWVIRRWRRLMKDFFRPYRPELHYMRGPGPKWREKHGGPGMR
jgi:hypothetical protein